MFSWNYLNSNTCKFKFKPIQVKNVNIRLF